MATTEKLEKYNYFIYGSNQSVEIIPCHNLRERIILMNHATNIQKENNRKESELYILLPEYHTCTTYIQINLIHR